MARKSKVQRHADELHKTITDIIYGDPDECWFNEEDKLKDGIADYLEKMSKIGGADDEDKMLAAHAAWYVRSMESAIKILQADVERLQEEVQILSSIDKFRDEWGPPIKDLLRASFRGGEDDK